MTWIALGAFVLLLLPLLIALLRPAARARRRSHDLMAQDAHRRAKDAARVGHLGEAPPYPHHRLGRQ